MLPTDNNHRIAYGHKITPMLVYKPVSNRENHRVIKQRRWLRWVSGIVLFLILIGVAISAAFYVSYSNGSLIRYIQKRFAQNLHFKVIHHSWYDGSPSLVLSNIQVFTEDQKQPVLRLEHARVVIDLWRSAWHQTLVTQKLDLSGANITLQQEKDGSIVLKGQSFKHRSTHDLSYFAHLISLQHYISIHSVHLHLINFYQPALKGDFELALGGSGQKGQLILRSDNLQEGPDAIFPKAWPLIRANLQLGWQSSGRQWLLTVKKFTAQTNNALLQLKGTVTVPAQWQRSLLNITASLNGHHLAEAVPAFIPKKGVAPDLYQWLTQNILKLGKAQAALHIQGPLDQIPFAKGQGLFDIKIQAEGGSLIPFQAWPEIDGISGSLLFHNQSFKAIADAGNIYGDSIHQVVVTVPDLMPGVPSEITVDGSMQARGKNTERYVDNSPLKNTVRLFQFASLKGPYRLNLDLSFPLANPQSPERITGVLAFKNNVISLKALPLKITQLSGAIHFNKTAINAPKNLSGLFLGKPLLLQISTDQNNVSRLLFKGQLSADGLQKQFNLPLLKKLSGASPFTATVTQGVNQTDIQVSSSLIGIQSDLPNPFTKASKTAVPFSIESHALVGGAAQMKLRLGKAIKADLLLNASGNLEKVAIVAGLPSEPVLPQKSEISGMVYIPTLSVSPWLHLFALPRVDSKARLPIDLTLGIGQLQVFGQLFSDLKLKVEHADGAPWQLKLDSKKIKGSVQVPSNLSKQAILIRLDHLTIDSTKTLKKQKAPLSLGELSQWPALNVMISHFFWKDKAIGRLAIQMIPETWGIKIPSLNWHNDDIDLMVKAALLQKDREVQIEGQTSGQNYGQALSDIGLNDLLTLTKGKTRFNLSWEGGVLNPNIKTLNGFVHFDLTDGLLSSVNPGISRLLGVFSLQALSRRLSLNFSDLTQKGLAFNRIKGNYRLRSGVAKTDLVSMSGPALDLTLKGELDLVKKNMNQTVKVMPHVDSGLAIAATILGGPIVGIATWVGDQLLSNTVFKDKGLEYTLTGPWDKPVFKTLEAKEG